MPFFQIVFKSWIVADYELGIWKQSASDKMDFYSSLVVLLCTAGKNACMQRSSTGI